MTIKVGDLVHIKLDSLTESDLGIVLVSDKHDAVVYRLNMTRSDRVQAERDADVRMVVRERDEAFATRDKLRTLLADADRRREDDIRASLDNNNSVWRVELDRVKTERDLLRARLESLREALHG